MLIGLSKNSYYVVQNIKSQRMESSYEIKYNIRVSKAMFMRSLPLGTSPHAENCVVDQQAIKTITRRKQAPSKHPLSCAQKET